LVTVIEIWITDDSDFDSSYKQITAILTDCILLLGNSLKMRERAQLSKWQLAKITFQDWNSIIVVQTFSNNKLMNGYLIFDS